MIINKARLNSRPGTDNNGGQWFDYNDLGVDDEGHASPRVTRAATPMDNWGPGYYARAVWYIHTGSNGRPVELDVQRFT